jgi:hypothetical protein
VTADPIIANGGILLWSIFGILHIPEVVFTLRLVPVYVTEVVFRELEGNSEKSVKGVQNFRVKELWREAVYATKDWKQINDLRNDVPWRTSQSPQCFLG